MSQLGFPQWGRVADDANKQLHERHREQRAGHAFCVISQRRLGRSEGLARPDQRTRGNGWVNSSDASLVARYENALKQWLAGDDQALEPFVGRTVNSEGRTVALVTDHAILMRQARRGELTIETLYASVE